MCTFLPDDIFPARVGAPKSRDPHVPRAYDTAELKERFISRLKESWSNMESVDNMITNFTVRAGVCLSGKPNTTWQFQWSWRRWRQTCRVRQTLLKLSDLGLQGLPPCWPWGFWFSETLILVSEAFRLILIESNESMWGPGLIKPTTTKECI